MGPKMMAELSSTWTHHWSRFCPGGGSGSVWSSRLVGLSPGRSMSTAWDDSAHQHPPTNTHPAGQASSQPPSGVGAPEPHLTEISMLLLIIKVFVCMHIYKRINACCTSIRARMLCACVLLKAFCVSNAGSHQQTQRFWAQLPRK